MAAPRRARRGKAFWEGEVVPAMERILREIQPASGRAVGYRLLGEHIIDNMSEMKEVYWYLARAREDGAIPWHWVADDTRTVEGQRSWDVSSPIDPIEHVRLSLQFFDGASMSRWGEQPRLLLLASEK